MTPAVSPGPSATVEWGIGARTMRGEAESGDLHVVAPFANGVLLAVIDGLGHGVEAAKASRVAAEILQLHAREGVTRLTQLCHAELRKTRGAVMSVASVRTAEKTIEWIGVGNVEGVLFRADRSARPPREALLLRGGVVGYQLPSLRAAVLPIALGDTLIFATDGIRAGFSEDLPLDGKPREIAQDILSRYGKQTDDALVLVAHYVSASW